MSSKLFRDPLTFLDLPRSTDFDGADVAILGIPFDCARDLTRFGPRQGPNAVRHASILTRKLMQDADPFPLESISVIDAGNVDLPMDDIAFFSLRQTIIQWDIEEDRAKKHASEVGQTSGQ
jgi:arginase family enzyme